MNCRNMNNDGMLRVMGIWGLANLGMVIATLRDVYVYE
jgi:hypothetical protein